MRLVHYPAGGAADDVEADSDSDSDSGPDSGPDSDTGSEPDSAPRTLATDVDVAETTLEKARGFMFRLSAPEGGALVFPFDDVDTRDLHMLFVPFALDAVWLVDGEVRTVKRLRPWLGVGWAAADTVVELPAGAAADVEPGDRIELVED
ncbi:DUF192 domain-containing protein [Halobaculum sp. D14]|uniref:DUF192 domain-containing protein n=1 Tax=Halobaculum sp. D14 TaxID=3421642 RepID=UPI003EBA24F6